MSPELRTWRHKVFASTYLCYAALYFARKPFSVVKSDLGDAVGFDAAALGLIGSVYLVAYAIGQFLAAGAGTRFGPRRVLLVGLAGSAIAHAGFGIANSISTFCVLMALNGLFQATGWANTVGTMGSWFRREERGTVMGFWATCYQVGGFTATPLAAWILGRYGYQYSFFAGSAVVVVAFMAVAAWQRNRPEDVGLSLGEDDDEVEAEGPRGGVFGTGWSREVVTTVGLVGGFYFFVKFIRYALWSWVPFFLRRNYDLAGDDAGYISTLFDGFGILGVLVAGRISDTWGQGRRAKTSFVFLIGMGASTLFLYSAGQVSVTFFAIAISAVGFSLYGPDALMTGAGAQDIGNKRGATLAAGVINGMGAIGAVVQEFVIGRMYDSSGGDLGPILGLLIGASVGATAFMGIVLIRNRMGLSDA
jgi:MFS transporter, OPA family, sugar phosphate sensor protein UhpC